MKRKVSGVFLAANQANSINIQQQRGLGLVRIAFGIKDVRFAERQIKRVQTGRIFVQQIAEISLGNPGADSEEHSFEYKDQLQRKLCGGGVTAESFWNASSGNFSEAAARFCSKCCTEDVPGIGNITRDRLNNQAIAT